jgi:phage tail sheath protein FI
VSVLEEILSICRTRNDCLGIIDPPLGLSVQEVTDWHNGTGEYTGSHQAFTANQGALYYPWVKQFDPYTSREVWLPPTAFVPAVIAYTDRTTDLWWAPAGITRGKIDRALQAETVITQAHVDYFYGPGNGNAVNPIQTFSRDGIVVYGQRTLQRYPSALDRINVRRLLFHIEKVVATAARRLVFDQNDELLWGQFRALVEPFLETLEGQRALEWFRVVCDETTNTPARRNNNEVYARVFIIPVKSAEKFIIDFTLLPSGANVNEYIATDASANTNS